MRGECRKAKNTEEQVICLLESWIKSLDVGEEWCSTADVQDPLRCVENRIPEYFHRKTQEKQCQHQMVCLNQQQGSTSIGPTRYQLFN